MMHNTLVALVLRSGKCAVLLAAMLVAGCGAREESHWLVTKPIGYREVSIEGTYRPVYVLYDRNPRVYLSFLFDREVSTKCSDWFWFIPFDRISRSEQQINAYSDKQGELVSVGVTSDDTDEKFDLHKVALNYNGREYRPVSITEALRSEEISEAVNIAAGVTITWYNLKYDVHVNVRRPFYFEIGGISKGGKDMPSMLIQFSTKEKVLGGEYGEAGCPI